MIEKPQREVRGNRKGWTLVELLVSSVIVSVIAIGITSLFVLSKRLAYKTGDEIIALNQTRIKMLEEIIGKIYNFKEAKKRALENYEQLVTSAGDLPALASLEGKYQIDVQSVCSSVNNIQYCYKEANFTSIWNER
ncbi:MAG: hypothetical protein DRP75_02655 [Candidatus Omnitrophota bacterium]|nr:MAG: hypothetical protein DRP75_02655 [Candidatus Omnitrophota bacterium]